MWAEHELGIHASLTSGTERQIVEVLKEVLLFQCTLKGLVKCFLRAQNEIEQKPRQEKQDNQERRENLSKYASASRFDISKRPSYERKPDRDEISDPNREQELSASCGGFDHVLRPLGSSTLMSIATHLSVPDALEPSDRKDKHARPPHPLFSRTRDPELCSLGYRPQGLSLPGTTSSPRLNQHHHVVNEIIFDTKDHCGQSSAADRGIALNLCR
jgi:hypothetical protein